MRSIFKIFCLFLLLLPHCAKKRVAANSNSKIPSGRTGEGGEGVEGFIRKVFSTKDNKYKISVPYGSSTSNISIKMETSQSAETIILNQAKATMEDGTLNGIIKITASDIGTCPTGQVWQGFVTIGNEEKTSVYTKNEVFELNLINIEKGQQIIIDFDCVANDKAVKLAESVQPPKTLSLIPNASSVTAKWSQLPGIDRYFLIYLPGNKLPKLCSDGYVTLVDLSNWSAEKEGLESILKLVTTDLKPNTVYKFALCAAKGIGVSGPVRQSTTTFGAQLGFVVDAVTGDEFDGDVDVKINGDPSDESVLIKAFHGATYDQPTCADSVETWENITLSKSKMTGVLELLPGQYYKLLICSQNLEAYREINVKARGNLVFAVFDSPDRLIKLVNGQYEVADPCKDEAILADLGGPFAAIDLDTEFAPGGLYPPNQIKIKSFDELLSENRLTSVSGQTLCYDGHLAVPYILSAANCKINGPENTPWAGGSGCMNVDIAKSIKDKYESGTCDMITRIGHKPNIAVLCTNSAE